MMKITTQQATQASQFELAMIDKLDDLIERVKRIEKEITPTLTLEEIRPDDGRTTERNDNGY